MRITTAFFINIAIFFLIINISLFAQNYNDTTKKVVVVREYQPIINDAYKINIEPDIQDTVTIKPLLFKYYFVEYPIFVNFEPEKIKAATMRGEPLYPLFRHYLDLSIGSQITPFRFIPSLEYFFNSDRNPNFVYGAHVKFFHASGKIKMENGNKIDAPLTDNIVEIYGKRIMRHSNLSTTAFLKRNVYNYYGIPYFLDTIPQASSISQRFVKAGIKNNWRSTNKDTTQLFYDGNLNYNFTNDKII